MKIIIVGCGNIAGPYSEDIKKRDNLEIVGFFDVDNARATQFAAKHGGKAYATLDEALADPEADAIVNLTIFEAHYDITKRALLAGKHVYSEKPLALKTHEALELLNLAETQQRRLACAPITFLGEAQQTALKRIRDGGIGTLRVIYAEVNHGRIESWHPNPAPFYAVGPMLDVGVYPLALVTALLGPAQRLQAFATTLHPNRVAKDGTAFVVEAPDFYVVNLSFPGGVVMRLTVNFYVAHNSKQAESLEFHGDAGSLALGSWFYADSTLEEAAFGEAYQPLPLLQTPKAKIDWARGLADFAEAFHTGGNPRVTGAHAAHIVEILEAANTSARTGQSVDLSSTFVAPAAMDWAR